MVQPCSCTAWAIHWPTTKEATIRFQTWPAAQAYLSVRCRDQPGGSPRWQPGWFRLLAGSPQAKRFKIDCGLLGSFALLGWHFMSSKNRGVGGLQRNFFLPKEWRPRAVVFFGACSSQEVLCARPSFIIVESLVFLRPRSLATCEAMRLKCSAREP